MRFDFWNNPLVISSFRVKHRRGGLLHIVALYMLVLVLGGAVLEYYREDLGNKETQQIYFIVIMALQFVLSPLLAAVATSSSMKAEVVNRTLDFQRLTALSPRQILLGKLLGEPALAYLLALATVPLTMFCCALGVPGVSLVELLLLYVQLATTTLLFGCAGLLNRLEQTEGRGSSGGAAGGTIWGWLLMSVWLCVASGLSGLNRIGPWSTPWYLAPCGLPAPVFSLFGTALENPWFYVLRLYGRRVPYLLLTPVVQLAIAYLCFQTMVRRLINPLNTALPKGTAYGCLLAVDVLAAAVLFQPRTAGLAVDPGRDPLGAQAAIFCVIHLAASCALITGLTPWRQSLQSWVWRYRRRQHWLRGLWLGERAPNTLATWTCAALGVLSLALLVVLPAVLTRGWEQVRSQQPALLAALALTVLLIGTFGTLFQWFELFAGRSGGSMTMLLLVCDGLPHLAGRYYELNWVLALSPSAHYFRWCAPDSPLNLGGELPLWPVLGLYGCLLGAAWWHLRATLRRLEDSVDAKLDQMGVPLAIR